MSWKNKKNLPPLFPRSEEKLMERNFVNMCAEALGLFRSIISSRISFYEDVIKLLKDKYQNKKLDTNNLISVLIYMCNEYQEIKFRDKYIKNCIYLTINKLLHDSLVAEKELLVVFENFCMSLCAIKYAIKRKLVLTQKSPEEAGIDNMLQYLSEIFSPISCCFFTNSLVNLLIETMKKSNGSIFKSDYLKLIASQATSKACKFTYINQDMKINISHYPPFEKTPLINPFYRTQRFLQQKKLKKIGNNKSNQFKIFL